ncbi:NADP-dependent 3-hydroxy acid dehydrogenase YdfG [Tistlia consotensis]|uniref:NADP-dependent 3-hydroxy acid dehydrogenase YdfG n=1 Tax=Tistlia consotensis USBA 355 TaxID=560819 RepID=A0A1Y6BWB8_9PROT|nr:SDR family oxidoreductase [Tistlia consotensis]SMF32030.1 NADP-dependent 3-hydroxy acid dehydrogenase YdfG [Tistlia consotensis USBA 355]SNR68005.1 NADP-dependent 3-hydroxy acid dehydrogenase YdfG [Tistlia consotensis]
MPSLMPALAGRRALVTGAARGLGAAFAVVLADLGAEVVATARRRERLEPLAGAIAARCGRRPETLALDLADDASLAQAAEAVAAGGLDLLVNNGAFWLPGRLAELAPEEIRQAVDSAVTGTLLVTRALLPALLAAPAGDIVTVVSMSGLPNVPLFGASPAFYAAKHGQAGLADGLRQELRGTPVRSIAIHPPMIEDVSPLEPAWDGLPARGKERGITNRDVVEAALFALGRPRSCTVASLVLDADSGGIFG